MKNHLNVVLFSLIAATGAVLLSGCGTTTTASGSGSDAKKIGVVLIGDETEGYSKAHIDGINEAAKELNISDRLIYKYKIQEDDGCKTAIDDLISEDCGLIISNSYGHQDYMAPAAKANPDVTFISMTGDYAAVSKISNFKNAFVSIYEARYVSGIVAGMKLKELADAGKLDTTFNKDSNGNWKIGYVGAYKYSEVVSGYTSFYLGVKSVISNVSMQVQFTNSWFDISGEGAAADALVKNGCVVIGQHDLWLGSPEWPYHLSFAPCFAQFRRSLGFDPRDFQSQMEHKRNPLHLDDELYRNPTRQFLYDDLARQEQFDVAHQFGNRKGMATPLGWQRYGASAHRRSRSRRPHEGHCPLHNADKER